MNALLFRSCVPDIASKGSEFYVVFYAKDDRMSRAPSELRSARMGALARLPAFFALEGKRAVVAGGSQAAAWKAELLSAAGAKVDVFAPVQADEHAGARGRPAARRHRDT